jgi:hypothetical protein
MVLFLAVLPLLFAPVARAEPLSAVPSEGAAASLEKQAEEIEAKLAQEPDNEGLLASLTRTRINIANVLISEGVGESKVGVDEVRQQLTSAALAWSKYLKATSKPAAGLATQVAPALFQLAELSTGGREAFKYVKAAATAEQIVAKDRPSRNSWSTLAIYDLFAQKYGAADKALEKAIAHTHGKSERESLEETFKEIEKKAKQFGKKLKRR